MQQHTHTCQNTCAAPTPQPCGKEGPRLCPGHNAMQHALGHHAHRRVVHLCKRHCHLQPGVESSITALVRHMGNSMALTAYVAILLPT